MRSPSLSRFRLLYPPKPVQWPKVKWTPVDDAKLLVAIYEYGLGNWEAIRDSDPQGLGKKILPENRALKPQSSHLQTRAEYLLKVLQAEAKRKMAKKSRQSPRKAATSRSKAKKKGSTSTSKQDLSKFFGHASAEQAKLLVNISRDLVSVNNSDAESNASSTKSGRGQKRPRPPSKQPVTKRLKSSPKKSIPSRLSSRQDRTPTPGSRSSPRKAVRERGAQKQLFSQEEGVLSALEGGSDDQRVSDIGDEERELDQDTFEKVTFNFPKTFFCHFDIFIGSVDSVFMLWYIHTHTLTPPPPPHTHTQCKSLLKPVKKSLKELSQSGELSKPEILVHYKKVWSRPPSDLLTYLLILTSL